MNEAQLEEELRELEKKLREFDVYGGLSRKFTSADDIRGSYELARDAMEAGSLLKTADRLVRYENIEMFTLMRYAGKSVDLNRYVMPGLTELQEYDGMYGTDYYATLYLYLWTNNKKITAEKLHVHKNTLSYRLQRISEILGLDIEQGEIRMRMLLSFYAERVIRNASGRTD